MVFKTWELCWNRNPCFFYFCDEEGWANLQIGWLLIGWKSYRTKSTFKKK